MPVKRTILHIDDDEDDREMVKNTIELADERFRVRQADCGRAGISFLQKAKESGELPSLVVLDLNMAGMDGKAVLKTIKQDCHLSKIPVIIFTTSSSELDKMFAKKEGVEMITKPSTLTDFSETVKRFLSYC